METKSRFEKDLEILDEIRLAEDVLNEKIEAAISEGLIVEVNVLEIENAIGPVAMTVRVGVVRRIERGQL